MSISPEKEKALAAAMSQIDRKYGKGGIVGNRDLIRPVSLFEQGPVPRTAVTFDLCLEKA